MNTPPYGSAQTAGASTEEKASSRSQCDSIGQLAGLPLISKDYFPLTNPCQGLKRYVQRQDGRFKLSILKDNNYQIEYFQ